MTATLHGWLGVGIVTLLGVLALWGLGLRLARRDEAPAAYWGLQHWTENLLLLQTVIGIVFLLMGRRVPPIPLDFLHYLYGSLFPLIAVVAGRIAGMRREQREYVGLAWGGFFAWGLTLRAIQTGCAGILSWACMAP